MDLKLEDLKKSLGRMYSRIPPMVGRSRIFSIIITALLSSLDHHMPPFQPGFCRGDVCGEQHQVAVEGFVRVRTEEQPLDPCCMRQPTGVVSM